MWYKPRPSSRWPVKGCAGGQHGDVQVRTSLALAGAAATAVGLAAGHLVALLTDRRLSPVTVVGAAAIDGVPRSLKEWAIQTFGTWDKAVVVIVVIAVTAAVGAVIGLLGRRRLAPAAAAAVGLGTIPWYLGSRYSGQAHLVCAITVVAGVAALAHLRSLALQAAPAPDPIPIVDNTPDEPEPTPANTRLPEALAQCDRRRFLTRAAVVTGGSGALALAGSLAPEPAPVMTRTIPAAATALPPLPAGLAGPGIATLQTPTADFFRIDIALTVPRVRADTWRLDITGLVDTPYRLSYDELLAMPMVEHDITLACVSNEVGGDLIGAARWQGVPVADLLRRAGPRAEADMVLSSGPDGFCASTPLQVLLDGRTALVAVAMNGEPLTSVHGFPARLVTPGLYGFVGATKWLRELRLTRFDQERAYWTGRGWSAYGPVKIASRIDTPTGRKRLPAGQVVIGGVAWADHQGISAVEIQIDQGPWQPASLGPRLGTAYWVQWRHDWDATPGEHQLRVRAVDNAGMIQTEARRPVAPDGATGLHQVSVTVT